MTRSNRNKTKSTGLNSSGKSSRVRPVFEYDPKHTWTWEDCSNKPIMQIIDYLSDCGQAIFTCDSCRSRKVKCDRIAGQACTSCETSIIPTACIIQGITLPVEAPEHILSDLGDWATRKTGCHVFRTGPAGYTESRRSDEDLEEYWVRGAEDGEQPDSIVVEESCAAGPETVHGRHEGSLPLGCQVGSEAYRNNTMGAMSADMGRLRVGAETNTGFSPHNAVDFSGQLDQGLNFTFQTSDGTNPPFGLDHPFGGGPSQFDPADVWSQHPQFVTACNVQQTDDSNFLGVYDPQLFIHPPNNFHNVSMNPQISTQAPEASSQGFGFEAGGSDSSPQIGMPLQYDSDQHFPQQMTYEPDSGSFPGASDPASSLTG